MAFVAVAGLRRDGTVEANRPVAGVADVEVPVGRGVDGHHRRAVRERPLVHLESAAAFLPAHATNFTHGFGFDLWFSTFGSGGLACSWQR